MQFVALVTCVYTDGESAPVHVPYQQRERLQRAGRLHRGVRPHGARPLQAAGRHPTDVGRPVLLRRRHSSGVRDGSHGDHRRRRWRWRRWRVQRARRAASARVRGGTVRRHRTGGGSMVARCPLKAAFHDADTYILADSPDTPPREDLREEIARVGRKDVGVSGESVSVTWNAVFTPC